MQIGLFTNGTFNGIPPLKYLISYFYNLSGKKVRVFHNEVKGISVFNESEAIVQPMAVFANTGAMLQQNWRTKIVRHFKLLYWIIKFQATNKRSVLYCMDIITCNLLLLSQVLFFFRRNKIIYHQFEMYDPARAGRFDKANFRLFKKLLTRLDLVIIPEQNRLTYFRNLTGIPERIPAFVFPNTNSYKAAFIPEKTRVTDGNNIIIGHIGSLGTGQHFIQQYIEVLKALPANFRGLFVGRITPEVKSMLKSLGDRVEIVDHVLQHELRNVYARIDIGIILYHPYELNTRYAAPTKMYEYWSCGVPVIAHELVSLQPLFNDPLQGVLTDMGDVETFHKDLLHISRNLANWDREALKQYFKDHFDLELFIAQLDNTVRSTL